MAPNSVAGWRVYYPDEVYAADGTEWRDLPDEGVQVVVLYYTEFAAEGVHYRKLLDGHDYYYHIPGTDEFGETNDREDIPDEAIVKKGLEIPDNEFFTIKQAAVDSTWRR